MPYEAFLFFSVSNLSWFSYVEHCKHGLYYPVLFVDEFSNRVMSMRGSQPFANIIVKHFIVEELAPQRFTFTWHCLYKKNYCYISCFVNFSSKVNLVW